MPQDEAAWLHKWSRHALMLEGHGFVQSSFIIYATIRPARKHKTDPAFSTSHNNSLPRLASSSEYDQ